jgi:hypothetical protein
MTSEEVVLISSDSDEDCKPFGSRLKKHKIESASEDEYEPPSVKRTKRIETAGSKSTASEKRKGRTAPTERKPKATAKRTVTDFRVVKQVNKNETVIYFSIQKFIV